MINFNNKIDKDVIQNLKKYQGKSHLKKEAMNILVKTLKESEILHLKTQFLNIDKDHTGMISV